MNNLLSTSIRALLAGLLTVVFYVILHTVLTFPWDGSAAVFLGLSISQMFAAFLSGENNTISGREILRSLIIGLLAGGGLLLGLWIAM
jgi:VIT1/CCC1 family predicted Fe2+/Mn2+ transporter